MLKEAGWKNVRKGRRIKRKSKDQEIYTKRYGPIWIEAVVDTWIWGKSFTLHAPVPRSLATRSTLKILEGGKDPAWEEAWKALSVRLEYDKTTPQLIDRTARELVQTYKSLAAPRKRKTYENFEWGGKIGPDAFKAWVKEVEEVILTELKRTKENSERVKETRSPWSDRPPPPPYEQTHSLVMNILDNYMMEPSRSLSRSGAQKKIRAILEALAKKGKITKVPAGHIDRNVWWGIE